MWELYISVDNGSTMTWVRTPYKNLSEAENYVKNIYRDAVFINQRYQVDEG